MYRFDTIVNDVRNRATAILEKGDFEGGTEASRPAVAHYIAAAEVARDFNPSEQIRVIRDGFGRTEVVEKYLSNCLDDRGNSEEKSIRDFAHTLHWIASCIKSSVPLWEGGA